MIFETERCVISPINPNDKLDLFSMCDDINVWQYLGGVSTAERHRKNIQHLENLAPEFCSSRWTIRNKTNNLFLGYTSLDTHHDGDDMELSYMLLSNHWGNGYATEAAREIIRYAFNEKRLDRLVAEAQSVNLGSRHVLEKLGFYKIKELTRFNAEQTLYALDNPSK